MVLLRISFLVFSLLFLCSCAKVQYLWEQGQGQMSLLNRARPNEEVLKDVRVPRENKDKIERIQVYKDYFYRYFGERPANIYSKTSLLDREAVTYLVIASPHNDIKAKEECFSFMGCFPYLGFFQLPSAQGHAKNLIHEGWVTWIRPVYAYSTLGHFSDPILSSFFSYPDYELAEMVFHELFHTIFWVKNEVELNENLAVYFSETLAVQYFNLDSEKKVALYKKKKNYDLLMKSLLSKVEDLKKLYAKIPESRPQYSQEVFKKFLQDDFLPAMQKTCHDLGMGQEKCWPLKREWNNAAFAALLTYQSRGEVIASLHQKQKSNLKDFYSYIQKQYDIFKKRDEDSFANYLLTL